jgi:hypothetical protein
MNDNDKDETLEFIVTGLKGETRVVKTIVGFKAAEREAARLINSGEANGVSIVRHLVKGV